MYVGYAVTLLNAFSHWREGFLLGSWGGSSSRSYFPSRSYSSAAEGSRTRRVKDETGNTTSLEMKCSPRWMKISLELVSQ